MTLTQIMNEMPKVFLDKVNPQYIENNLVNIINQNLDKVYHIEDDIYQIPTGKFSAIYLIVEEIKSKKIVIGATNLKSVNYCGESYLQPIISKKFEKKYPNLLLKLYKQASKDFGAPIISDKEQSLDSSTVWRKWFNNPSKYNLKVKVINTKDCKDKTDYSELDIWGLDEKEHMLVSIED